MTAENAHLQRKLCSGLHLDDAIRTGEKTAVVGAAAGGVGAAMSEPPNNAYHHFVQRCVSEKGLEVIGWN